MVPQNYLQESLTPRFRVKLLYVLEELEKEGQHAEVFTTLRDPIQQAVLWMKSRSEQEIGKAISKLNKEKAFWLAGLMEKIHRPFGRWETNNLPGLSWHQWGEAAAIRIVSDSGRVVWNPRNSGYKTLAEAARRVGLTSGFYWKNRDAVHIQLRVDAVRAYYTWSEIDQHMKEKFNGPFFGNSSAHPSTTGAAVSSSS